MILPKITEYTQTDHSLDLETLKEYEEIERIQKECEHSHEMKDLDPEDGCIHCGFYSK